MDIIAWIFMSVLPMVADGFTVRGPSAPLVAPLGSSVVLPCYVDDGLLMEDLEVEWRRTDSEALVHLYQEGKSQSDAQQQDYHDRAHFFTEEIQHGNFSIRLDNLRAEDKGAYRCTVYSQQDSGETVVQIKDVECLLVSGSNWSVSAYGDEDVTLNLSLRLKSVRTEDKGVYICRVFAGHLSASATVILGQLGFSSWHIAVLVFCFAAGSGALLLFCTLLCCISKNTDTSSTIWKLQLYLVFFPNICLFLAFILWGFTEGYLDETITCCALYFLRPIMLIWALPCLKYLQGNLKPWISFFTITRTFAFLTVVFYAVLGSHGWRLRAYDTDIALRVVILLPFGIAVLMCLILSSVDFLEQTIWLILGLDCIFRSYFFFCISILSCVQFIQLVFSFGLPSQVYFIVPLVCVLMLMPVLLHLPAVLKCLQQKLVLLLWITTILLLDIISVYIHLVLLEGDKDCLEWICVIVFLEVLRMIALYVFEKQKQQQQTEMRQRGSNAYHLCHEIMYMFGVVGVVWLSSVTLTAELILKARNGERSIEDLRVIVFPSECAFALYWLLLEMQAYWKVFIGSTHSQR